MDKNLKDFEQQLQQAPENAHQQNEIIGDALESRKQKFTQEDVNHIISDRLTKERTRLEGELAKREQELAKRELQFRAKELLTKKKLSTELSDILNYADEAALIKNIDILAKYIKPEEVVTTVGTGCYSGSFDKPNIMRNAMGLR